jgi:hypothetical protein
LGSALIARAEIWLDVLSFWVPEGVSNQAFLAPVANPISAAKQALIDADLAKVQAYLETAGAGYHDILFQVWQQSPFNPASALGELTSVLESAGFETADESLGVSVALPRASNADRYSQLVSLIVVNPNVHLLLLSSWRASGEPAKESEKMAIEISQQLTAAGFPEGRLRIRAVGEEIPLQALKAGDVAAALLLVPVPNS